MSIKYIDADMLRNMFLAGANALEANKDWINELNVFPVPDSLVYEAACLYDL